MVYISSTNIVTSLGFTTTENIEKISQGISGITILDDKKMVPETVAVSIVNNELLEQRFVEISNNTNFTRFEKFVILSVSDALKQTKIDIRDSRTILIISTTKGNIDMLDDKMKEKYHENRLHLWKSAQITADFFMHPNRPLIISNACISGALALITAKRLIDSGMYDNAVVVGADILSEFTLSGFIAFKAVSSQACRPFDAARDGMTPGEGAGTLILTKFEQFSTVEKIALIGGGNSNDANHISGPSRTGAELSWAINIAMNEAGMTPANIDMISAHGTATLFNDESEGKAICLSNLETVPVSAIKSYIGHTFAAAGIIETIVAFESIKRNEIYTNLGYENHGIPNNINIRKEKRLTPLKTVVKTASGFGGVNAALILSKSQEYKEKFEIHKPKLNITKNVIIRASHASVNGKNIFLHDNYSDFAGFSKSLYKYLNISYQKFYKMDNLSKMAFLASEILLNETNFKQKYNPEDIAIILSNGSSSSDTDAKYFETIKNRADYFPAPSVFVYTLANVMVGEISIRHGIKGENCVFISEKFDPEFLKNYTEILFRMGRAKAAIIGRVDYDYPHAGHEAVLYFIEKLENIDEKTIFDTQNLKSIYFN